MDTKQVRVVKQSRRMRTLAEKRGIVEETLQPGASVAMVARRHEVNANLVFGWRRLYQQGLLEPDAAINAPRLLPVQISAPSAAPIPEAPTSGAITITLANGHRIELRAPIDAHSLAPVLDLLLPRC
jgi:transposase